MARTASKRSGYTDRVRPEERIQRLEASVQRLLQDVERLPADVLYREPRAGEWSVMSTLAHVAEILPYWAHQAEKIAREPGAPFGRTHEDADRIAAVERHSRDALDATVARIRARLDESIKALRALPAEAWATAGQHPSRGSMSIDEIIDRFLVNHVQEHAAQVNAAVTALAPSRL
jgi:uncharacterized damage-inducible protein DinB